MKDKRNRRALHFTANRVINTLNGKTLWRLAITHAGEELWASTRCVLMRPLLHGTFFALAVSIRLGTDCNDVKFGSLKIMDG